MKNVLATILALVYLSTSLGATIHLHYCMGKLASWSLIDRERKTCGRCGMVIKKTALQSIASKTNCCKDEHKLIRTNTDQKLSPSEPLQYGSFSQSIATNEPATQIENVFSFPIGYLNTHAPPLIGNLPRFIFYCSFRI
jgi:hypothetical protein